MTEAEKAMLKVDSDEYDIPLTEEELKLARRLGFRELTYPLHDVMDALAGEIVE